MRTCIISWISSNFGQIWQLTTELAALELRKKIPWLIMEKTKTKNEIITFSRLFSAVFDRILFILAGNEDIHKSLYEFEFRTDPTTDYGVSCSWASKNRCHHVISVDVDPILFKLASNKDMHNIMNEFEFRPDRTTDYGVSCPWASTKYPHRLTMGKMVFPRFSLLFLIGSFWYFHVTRTSIKAWMNSNFRQIRLLTTELAALECLKYQCPLFLGWYWSNPF